MSDDSVVLRETEAYRRWFSRLRDREAELRITKRLIRLRRGSFGDTKGVGGGVSELRVNYGPGYRVYFARRGNTTVVSLAGGDKRSQQDDIRVAQLLAAAWDDEDAS